MKIFATSTDISQTRVKSIDVFRGITIFAMIFVNDLASVKGMPQWLEHMPANANGMTFVDVVFPAFLFIVGMAIPFAINKRLKNGESLASLWLHIFERSAALLILGILMVNLSGLNEKLTGMNRNLWMLLVLLAAILAWIKYPKSSTLLKYLYISLRLIGLIALIYLAAIYRSGEVGSISWLHTKWWGILGLIGIAYLFVCSVYLLFKGNFYAMISMLFVFFILYLLDRAGLFDFAKPFLLVGEHVGVHSAITISGLIISLLFFENTPAKSSNQRILWIVLFSASLFILGLILYPFYGISKIYANDTWGLYSAAYCGWVFAFLSWLIDLKKKTKWVKIFEPAGRNPLLAYLLPDIYYTLAWLLSFNLLWKYFGEGISGFIRSLFFAFIMIGITALFNRMKIILHL